MKAILSKYGEPPITQEKTSRLFTFLHHLLKAIPLASSSKTSTSKQLLFPLGVLIEDIAPFLSLNTSLQSSWIMTLQFILSCFRSCPEQHIYHSGVTPPILLGLIKQVLIEFTALPTKIDVNPLEHKCFLVGKELLDLLLIRDYAITEDMLENSDTLTEDFSGIGSLTYYDVIYSVSTPSNYDKHCLIFFCRSPSYMAIF